MSTIANTINNTPTKPNGNVREWEAGKSTNTVEMFKSAKVDHRGIRERPTSPLPENQQDRLDYLEWLVGRQSAELTRMTDTHTRYLSILAHDLCSPMCHVVYSLELLKRCIGEGKLEDMEGKVGIGISSAAHTLKLLDNLLEWAVLQNKQHSFSPLRIILSDLITDELDDFELRFKQKKISVFHSVDPGLIVYADKQMVHTVLRNLLSNAVKFSNTGGAIYITANAPGNSVHIKVRDEGVGISEEVQGQINKNAFRVSTPGTNNERGTGLGLLLCKEFVALHGGEFFFESQQGRGSCFTFTLPVG